MKPETETTADSPLDKIVEVGVGSETEIRNARNQDAKEVTDAILRKFSWEGAEFTPEMKTEISEVVNSIFALPGFADMGLKIVDFFTQGESAAQAMERFPEMNSKVHRIAEIVAEAMSGSLDKEAVKDRQKNPIPFTEKQQEEWSVHTRALWEIAKETGTALCILAVSQGSNPEENSVSACANVSLNNPLLNSCPEGDLLRMTVKMLDTIQKHH